jgi:hypothetical protein
LLFGKPVCSAILFRFQNGPEEQSAQSMYHPIAIGRLRPLVDNRQGVILLTTPYRQGFIARPAEIIRIDPGRHFSFVAQDSVHSVMFHRLSSSLGGYSPFVFAVFMCEAAGLLQGLFLPDH